MFPVKTLLKMAEDRLKTLEKVPHSLRNHTWQRDYSLNLSKRDNYKREILNDGGK